MTLHQLKIFECVVRHMNITKASATLPVSVNPQSPNN